MTVWKKYLSTGPIGIQKRKLGIAIHVNVSEIISLGSQTRFPCGQSLENVLLCVLMWLPLSLLPINFWQLVSTFKISAWRWIVHCLSHPSMNGTFHLLVWCILMWKYHGSTILPYKRQKEQMQWYQSQQTKRNLGNAIYVYYACTSLLCEKFLNIISCSLALHIKS